MAGVAFHEGWTAGSITGPLGRIWHTDIESIRRCESTSGLFFSSHNFVERRFGSLRWLLAAIARACAAMSITPVGVGPRIGITPVPLSHIERYKAGSDPRICRSLR